MEKNDCEINAAKRLLERLRKDYLKLPVCIQGDALYAAEPVMENCNRNGWKYILTQKATRQKALTEGYEWIQCCGGAMIVKKIGNGEYVSHVEVVAGKKETADMYRY